MISTMKNALSTGICGLMMLAAHPLCASILTFNAGVGNDVAVPANYGDNITSTTMGTFSYGQGNGFTPNITADYTTIGGSYFAVWTAPNEYGDFTYSGLVGNEGVVVPQISLVAAPGYLVRLNSFDIAGYFDTNGYGGGSPAYQEPVSVLDGANNVLQNYGMLQIVPSSNSHQTFTPSVPDSAVIRIRFATDFWASISNVNFDQVAVPEPASFGILAMAGAAMVVIRRRRVKR